MKESNRCHLCKDASPTIGLLPAEASCGFEHRQSTNSAAESTGRAPSSRLFYFCQRVIFNLHLFWARGQGGPGMFIGTAYGKEIRSSCAH